MKRNSKRNIVEIQVLMEQYSSNTRAPFPPPHTTGILEPYRMGDGGQFSANGIAGMRDQSAPVDPHRCVFHTVQIAS